MATYKVPQDVEADDKLIGPFSFRQFIYLIIVAMAGALAWALSNIFIGLVIIPLPIIIFFGALALPLRKDQPMEIYMAAIVSFYLKPRLRKWDPEGVESLIEISAPKIVEVQRTKDLSQDEAQQRLSYLANIVDSGGWAIRGVGAAPGGVMNSDVYLEAQSAQDVLDTNTTIAQNFDQMMAQSTERMKEEARQRMMQATAPVAPAPVQAATAATAAPHFDPYPTIHQAMIQPLDEHTYQTAQPTAVSAPVADLATPQTPAAAYAPPQATAAPQIIQPAQTEESTSDTGLTAGIMNLASNSDLSIETIAHEAERLKKKAAEKARQQEESDDVIVSLR